MFEGVAAAAADKAKSSDTSTAASGRGDDAWVRIQKHTFTNWVNVQLKQVDSSVDQVEEDFKSGVKLIEMLEVISGKSFGRYQKSPKSKHHEIENLVNAFAFMKEEGINLVNIQGEDLNDGNLKLVLGLLWTIIYHYQIRPKFSNLPAAPAGKKTGFKDLLLEWVQAKVPERNVTNFNKDWQDGRTLCALVNSIGGTPYLVPGVDDMDPSNKVANARTGIEAARTGLGVPALVAAEDLTDPAVDDLSVITYVSYFKGAKRVSNAAPASAPAAAPEPTPAPAAAAAAPAPARAPAPVLSSDGSYIPPWERPADWREYSGPDLGGRCKICVYYSSTTSSQIIRKNTQALMNLLERLNVHKRPDFKPWVPIDFDMTKEKRDLIFEKAGTKKTPMLFIDDEYIGDYDRVVELNETGELDDILKY
eukprot:m.84877 g.84877  ORF g.84877 m.84877 type:complete len:420 (+) comp14821_c0_seq1:324-1583(+)